MEQAQTNTAQELTAQAIPQQAAEDAGYQSPGLIGSNCEDLEPVDDTHLKLPSSERG